MWKILAVNLLAFSCLVSSEANYLERVTDDRLLCDGCHRVHPKNECSENVYTCFAKEKEACFNRLVTKDGVILFMERGCTEDCSSVRHDEHYKNFTWCCDNKNKCNSRNPWP